MTLHVVGIDVARFIFIATAIVVVLVLLYRRRRASGAARRPAARTRTEVAHLRHQVAAIPVRSGSRGEIEVLVISTRGSGRWTVPKGWPMRGRSDAEAAAREAFEEAGVRGTITTQPIGTFEYVKRRNERETLIVTVYRLDVTSHVRRWRERGQRRQRWLPASQAAREVAWAGLAEIIRSIEATRAASNTTSSLERLRLHGDE